MAHCVNAGSVQQPHLAFALRGLIRFVQHLSVISSAWSASTRISAHEAHRKPDPASL